MPKTKVPYHSTTTLIFSSILHALILFSILAALFIFVISKLERDAFQNEIDDNINKTLPQALADNDKDGSLKLQLKTFPLDRMYKLYEKPEKATQVYNTWLFKTIILIGIFIAILILFSGVMLYYTGDMALSYGKILLENIIVFTFVGLFEAVFFKFIASKYVPVEPSLLVNRLYSDLKQWN